jgi:hypothetical protein
MFEISPIGSASVTICCKPSTIVAIAASDSVSRLASPAPGRQRRPHRIVPVGRAQQSGHRTGGHAIGLNARLQSRCRRVPTTRGRRAPDADLFHVIFDVIAILLLLSIA